MSMSLTVTFEEGFSFSPDCVEAAVGDEVVFEFFPLNHSVVRATYGYPCIPYDTMNPGQTGFFSQFRPLDEVKSPPPQFRVLVNDTRPIFYYCSTPRACLDFAMVGVINPDRTGSLTTQQAMARNSSFMLQPGEPWPSEADVALTGSAASPSESNLATTSDICPSSLTSSTITALWRSTSVLVSPTLPARPAATTSDMAATTKVPLILAIVTITAVIGVLCGLVSFWTRRRHEYAALHPTGIIHTTVEVGATVLQTLDCDVDVYRDTEIQIRMSPPYGMTSSVGIVP